MKRTCVFIAILVGAALPALAAQRVSVEQLEGILAQSQSLPDAECAAKLTDLQLTERFSSARLARWKAGLAGARAQRALMGLADRSAFLAPPAAEIPATATPDLAEQRRIMGLVANYVGQAIPQLPRFYASRTIVHFEDAPGKAVNTVPGDGEALHAVRISRATVLNRDGQEVVEPGPVNVKAQPAERGLKTWGAFGPILALVLLDSAQNKLAWERWEQSAGGNLAVFHYAVPKDRSHYEVRYCCVARSYGLESSSFSAMSAYHGEIAVDPASGIIQRLTIEAELDESDPIARAALMVEYGPVELGGMTYTCPTRSVSISVAKTLRQVQDTSGRSWAAMGPWQLLLNNVDFGQYHLFKTESRVLSGDEERAAGIAPDATLDHAQPVDMQQVAEEDLTDAPAARGGAAPASVVAEAGAGAAGTVQGGNDEIITTAAAALPDSPAEGSPIDAQPTNYTLRVNSRLVDVSAVALDKKGHPITDLKPEDFEVYDNGVKQDVRSFSRADAEDEPQTPAAEPTTATVKPLAFSNHETKSAHIGSVNGNTVILLVDPSNLAFNDFTDARRQMVQFARALPANERVALYVMRYHGYQVLQEGTTDHEVVATRLAKWMPSAQDLANAQDEENRNRQVIETVHSPEDLLSVNGNYTLDSGTQTEAPDAKLREMGSRPGPIALSVLVDVAHHLAAMPGHKSLVWITSDNSLADWNKMSVSIEKSSKYIVPEALRTQEAMNNAHVSVYPLDASRLEANVITAEIGRRNVELTPTFQLAPGDEILHEGPEATAGQDMNPYIQHRNFGEGGRLKAQMEQDIHPIQGVFREVAEATGGHAMRRSSNIVGELNGVVEDGHATYLLGFAPAQPADGKYHVLTVKLVKHKDATVRYRTGYQYDKEPTSLKERFAQAVWQPSDTGEISISTKPVDSPDGKSLRVTVAGADLALAEQSSVHTGKLDIFLVHRDEAEQHAKVTGLTVGLRLKATTYQRAMNEGLTFDERIDAKPTGGSYRVVVVDVNSGRIGSVTVPLAALQAESVTN